MNTQTRRAHWEDVYTSKGEDRVSWFQHVPDVSLAMIDRTGVGTDAAVVDVGAGASRLVDVLLDRGFHSVSALDLSAAALDVAKARLGARAAAVDWIVSDITLWQPATRYDIWHDRATFHFLTQPTDRSAYIQRLKLALKPDGFAIIATFAPDGPERCSGLPIVRYDAGTLAEELGPDFVLLEARHQAHKTPWAATQSFQFSMFRLAPDGAAVDT